MPDIVLLFFGAFAVLALASLLVFVDDTPKKIEKKRKDEDLFRYQSFIDHLEKYMKEDSPHEGGYRQEAQEGPENVQWVIDFMKEIRDEGHGFDVALILLKERVYTNMLEVQAKKAAVIKNTLGLK